MDKACRTAALIMLVVAPSGANAAVAPADDYAHAHQRVDIGGGRKMNLFCAGRGSPTVIFDSDAGSPAWDWLLVQPTVAKRNLACSYDRAGLGFSDAAQRPGTSANAVDDLHRLLATAGIKPPFVLVGQAYGGMNVQLYAYTYPGEVAGLVLVDAAHEDERARLDRLTNGRVSAGASGNVGFLQGCAGAARSGAAQTDGTLKQCIETQLRDAYGPALSETVRHNVGIATFWDANYSEESGLPTSADQLRAARKSFGALPLIYLTRGISPYLQPGQPPSAMNLAAEAEVKAMHDEIAGLSTRGSNRIVPGAGHDIQIDKPDAVIGAIAEILAEH